MNNRIPIVFCFDERIIVGASVAIKSLMDAALSSTSYDIKIFHSDITIKNQKSITKLAQNTNHTISFYYINPEIFKNAPRSKGSWTELVYYRLYIPEILKEYDKVIYSDVDVLFKQDLNSLYSTDIEGYEFGAVKAEKNTPQSQHKYFEENKNEFIFWSGLMLINCKKFREDNLFEKLLKNAEKFYDRLKFFDLDLVNITCNNILPVGLKYCVLQSFYYPQNSKNFVEESFINKVYSKQEIKNAVDDAAIVHYAGKLGKPWRMKKPYDDYQQYINKLPKELKVYTFRDFRKKLFNKK